MNDEELPQFPNYPVPHPTGIQQADSKFHKPLMKLVKNLAKPLKSRDPFHSRSRANRKMKKVRFY